MATHDPVKHIKFLRQTLSQDKKPLGFFISAGCPLAVNMPKDKWPLIPINEFSNEIQSKKSLMNSQPTSVSAFAITHGFLITFWSS